MTSLSPAFLESHLLYLTRRLLIGQSKCVLSKLIANTTGSVLCQFHVDQTLYVSTGYIALCFNKQNLQRLTPFTLYEYMREIESSRNSTSCEKLFLQTLFHELRLHHVNTCIRPCLLFPDCWSTLDMFNIMNYIQRVSRSIH